MSLFKRTYYRAASLVPIKLLTGFTQGDLLLPYHHLVSDEHARHIEQIFPYKNRRQFIKDLDYLLTHFHPIDPMELLQVAAGGTTRKPRNFLLTFDDGLREVYDVVAPILEEKGVPAIFFLNPAFLDNRELFYRNKISLILDKLLSHPPGQAVAGRIKEILKLEAADAAAIPSAIRAIHYRNKELADRLGDCLELSFDDFLTKERPYLSSDQVKEMIGKGFRFGAHSMDHPNYKLLSPEEQLSQTRQSCTFVKERFDLHYSFFSFPHEDAPVRQEFFDRLQEDSSSAPELLFGTQNQRKEPKNRVFHRFNAERPEYPIEGLIKGILLYNQQKRLMGGQDVPR